MDRDLGTAKKRRTSTAECAPKGMAGRFDDETMRGAASHRPKQPKCLKHTTKTARTKEFTGEH